jgi:tetratricopeptide (TPR) repeat protein
MALMAADAMNDSDGPRGTSRLLALGRMLLMDANASLLDRRRQPSGEVVLRLVATWDEVDWEGDLRVVPVALRLDGAAMSSLLPLDGEAMLAMAGGQPPRLPDEWPIAEIEHRYGLRLPDGFRTRDLPKPIKRTIEGAAIERTLVARSPDRIEGMLRLAVSRAGIPRKRVEELIDGLKPEEQEAPKIKVEMTLETLSSRGQVKEALAEARRLVAANPKEGYFRLKQAIVLMDAGLVEAAQREARRAVEIAPKDAYAYQVLAWTLESDLLGRRFGVGFDREGALQARRQQLALAGPRSRGAFDLANLLARNERGINLEPGAPLEEILQLTGELDSMDTQAAEVRALVLLRLGRGAEAETTVRKRLNYDSHQKYLLASIARARGIEAAIAELPALQLSGDAAGMVLMRAAHVMASTGDYQLAGALAAASARISSRLQREADDLGRLCLPQQCKPDSRPAAEALKRLQRACHAPASFKRAAPALVDVRVGVRADGKPASDDRLHEQVCRSVILGTHWPASRAWIDLDAAEDLEVVGDAQTGYRVRYRNLPANTSRLASTFFFTIQGASARFLGSEPTMAADEALRLVSAGRVKEAATWLGWVREIVSSGNGRNPLAEAQETLWGGQVAEAGSVREASAATAAYSSLTARRAIPALERALATNPEEARFRVLARALLNAHLGARDFPGADRAGDRIAKRTSTDPTLVAMRALAAALAKNCGKALAIAAPLGQGKQSADISRRLVSVASVCQPLDQATEAARRTAALDDAQPADDNGLAWLLAFRTGAAEEALTIARRAAQRANRRPAILHTLAVVAAQAGAIAEARTAIGDLLQRPPRGSLPMEAGPVWLVIGAIAESLGLKDEAAHAYGRVIEEPEAPPSPFDSPALARRRLDALTASHAGR